MVIAHYPYQATYKIYRTLRLVNLQVVFEHFEVSLIWPQKRTKKQKEKNTVLWRTWVTMRNLEDRLECIDTTREPNKSCNPHVCGIATSTEHQSCSQIGRQTIWYNFFTGSLLPKALRYVSRVSVTGSIKLLSVWRYNSKGCTMVTTLGRRHQNWLCQCSALHSHFLMESCCKHFTFICPQHLNSFLPLWKIEK